MIAILVVLAAGMFVLTHYVARFFEREQQHQAQFWFEKGQTELNDAQVQDAIHSLRSALAYSRDNFQYRLVLARALVRDQQLREAESYLLALWNQQPGNGTVNLQLARIEARNGDYQQALRYFHGAVYGVFEDHPEEQRRGARLELVDYLLQVKAVEQAQAELIALAGDLPRDPIMYVRVGNLFQQAHEPRRALDQYQAALKIEPRNDEALRGAGEAAFDLEQYADSERDLQRAVALGSKDQRTADLLERATLVRQMNPFLPRLSSRERARRVLAAFNQAEQRLQECATQQGEALQTTPAAPTATKQASAPRSPAANSSATAAPSHPSDLQTAYQRLADLKPRMQISQVARDLELPDTVLEAAANAEQVASQRCGAPSARDEALLLIRRRREQLEQ
jgi:tetratricopeptide (TPR) repeat protein